MSGSNGVLDGLTSGFVNKSKAGKALFILHPCAVLLIFVPVLKPNPDETKPNPDKQFQTKPR
jgi:hypothetical protein